MTLDDATLSAWESGYFPNHTQRPTIDDLLFAIEEDLKGNKQYPEGEIDHAALNEEFLAYLDSVGVSVNGTDAEIANGLNKLEGKEVDSIVRSLEDLNAEKDVVESMARVKKKREHLNDVKARALIKELEKISNRIGERTDTLFEQEEELSENIEGLKQENAGLKAENKEARKGLENTDRLLSFIRTGGVPSRFVPENGVIEYYQDGQRKFAEVSPGLEAAMKAYDDNDTDGLPF